MLDKYLQKAINPIIAVPRDVDHDPSYQPKFKKGIKAMKWNCRSLKGELKFFRNNNLVTKSSD